MHLVTILLPLRRNDGSPQPDGLFAGVRKELVERFGGLTAFARAPADGLWDGGEGESVDRDQLVVLEVLAETLDRGWWSAFRQRLERDFAQDEVLIRAAAVERL